MGEDSGPKGAGNKGLYPSILRIQQRATVMEQPRQHNGSKRKRNNSVKKRGHHNGNTNPNKHIQQRPIFTPKDQAKHKAPVEAVYQPKEIQNAKRVKIVPEGDAKVLENAPASFMTDTKFASMPLNPNTLKALQEVLHYDVATLVQRDSIPVALQGGDLLAKAKTGTLITPVNPEILMINRNWQDYCFLDTIN